MKIALKDLHPNPHKKEINGGKLNPEKLEKLKESIDKDGFWAGIQCREVNGEYQIPFGHHRVEAAKQHFGKDYVIDIPVLKLSDEQMVRMLANENSMQNEEYAIYQVDTVVMTGKFLQLTTASSSGHGSQKDSSRAISKFLGEKNWSHDKVSQYLRMHEQLNPELLKDLKNAPNVGNDKNNFTVSHARSIVRLEPKEQAEVYKEIKGKDITHREMHDIVTEIENGSSVKEAVRKIEKNRDGKETIRKALSPFEGQKIVLMCDSLIKSVKTNPISSYPEKGQVILRKMYSQLVELLTKELGG